MDKICELGYCPYAEPYAAQAYDLSCNDCQHYVEIGNWTDEELESLQTALKKKSVSTGINIADLFDTNPEEHAWKRKKQTNADRIRSMTDEELAEYLFERGNEDEYCYGICVHQDDVYACVKAKKEDGCIRSIVAWLKRESDGE